MSGQDADAVGLEQWSTRHVVLVGEMGVGKTSVGTHLSELLDRPHLDSDAMLQHSVERTGASFAETEGVGALHDLELRLFMHAVSTQEPAVVSPAASVLDSESARDALSDQVVVWLDAPIRVALERIEEGDHRRSVDSQEVERLRSRRVSHYREVSALHVDTTDDTPDVLAMRIANMLPGFKRQQGV